MPGIAVAIGAGLFYTAIQFLYMAAVQLLKPTKSPGPLFAEFLSHCMALVLLPYILRVAIPWPHEMFTRVEPLVFLGVFGAGHVFFKLMTFFAAMRGAPASRLRFALWLFAAIMSVGLSVIALTEWVGEIQQLRPRLVAISTVHEVEGVSCMAAEVTEGAVLDAALTAGEGSVLTLRVAAPRPDMSVAGQTIYVDAYLYGRQTKRYSTAFKLADAERQWVLLRIPAEYVPAEMRQCEVFWSSRKESGLRKLIGLRPIQTSNATLLISGPYAHDARAETEQPSIVVVSVEGLGSAHMSTFGYHRKTTPAMDRFVARAVTFSNAYTPCPSPFAGTFSALTGVGPLTHRRLAPSSPDAPDVETLAERLSLEGYATAAFTENGGAADEYAFGQGIEQGFEYVDSLYHPEDAEDGTLGGSKRTLERARAWIDKNVDVAFFVFVRVHELPDLIVRERYGAGLTENLQKSPPPKDVYDSTLAYLDGHIGAFLQYLRDQQTRKFTTVALMSPFGIDFNTSTPGPFVGLTENALRVPLILQSPTLDPEKRGTFVSLIDVAPTLLELARLTPDAHVEGHSVLARDYAYEPVSMQGDPIVMALRSEKYQFVWHSGLSAVSLEQVAPDSVQALNQVTRRETSYSTRDVAARNPKLVAEFREKLMAYAGITPMVAPAAP